MSRNVRLPLLSYSRPFVVLLAVLVVVLSTFVATIRSERTAVAATNNGINFQARLMSNTGGIAPDGYYNVEFKLYDAATSGTLLFTDTYYDSNGATAGNDARIRVANGYLTVNLGSQAGNAFPSTINWDQDIWLTMNIGGTTQTATPTWDGEMSPRLKLTAVPYAFRAGKLASLAGSHTGVLGFASSFGQDSVITLPDPGASTATVCYQNSSSCGFVTGSPTNFIQNQNASAQTTANFWISGTGRADGALQAPLFDTATGVALAIGTTNATQINLNQNVVIANNKTLTVNSGATSLTGATTGDALNVSNSTSTGNIAVFKDNATAVLTIADGGAATFANTVDSSTALKVVNSAGGNVLSVNTTGSGAALTVGRTGSPAHVANAVSGVYGSSAATNRTFTFSRSVPTGHSLVGGLVLSASTLVSITSITDTAGNTYTVDASVTNSSTATTYIFSSNVTNAITAGDTLSITIGTGTGRWVVSVEEFGNLVWPAVDKTSTNSATGTSLSSGATATTSQANEMLFGAFGFAAGRVFTAGSGYTAAPQLSTSAGTNDRSLASEWQYVTATGVQTATGTVDSSVLYSGAIVTYKSSDPNLAALAGTIRLADISGSNYFATLNANTLTADRTLSLPDETGTLCVQNSANCGFVTGTSANFIQNGTMVQTSANFNIRSAATGSVGGVIQGASGQTADLFDVQTWNGTTATTVVGVSNTGLLSASAGLTVTGGATSLTGAASGDALTVSNSTSTGNIAVLKDNSTTVLTVADGGAVTFTNSVNSAAGFQVQNAAATPLITLDTTNNASNLVTNPSFETNTTGWTQRTNCTLTRTTAQFIFGAAAGSCANTGAGGGMNYNLTLSGSTTYVLSLYVKGSASSSTLDFGYAPDGSTETTFVSTGNSVQSNTWTRLTLSFTTSTVSGTPYIFIKQSDGTSRTLFVDGVQLETGSNASAFRDSRLNLNGAITSPLLVQNAVDSNTAFAVFAANGNQTFNVNTKDGRVGIGSLNASAKLHVITNSASVPAGIFRAASSQTADIFQLQDSSGNVNAAFNATGAQLTLGRIASSGTVTQGKLLLGDGTTDNFTGTLQTAPLSANVTYQLPALATGTYDICTNGGNCDGTSGTGYILNQSASTQAANFNIRSKSTSAVTAVMQGASGQTADILQVQSWNGTTASNLLTVSAAGVLTLAGGQTADITTATAGTANGLTLQPGISSANTTTGAATSIKGGDVSGTTTVTGGAVTVQGGSATGGSGTRNGGAVTIDGGTGATAAGAVNIGTSNAPTVNIGSVGTTNKATTIAIGTSTAAAQGVTLGSSNASSTIVVQGGTGGSAVGIQAGASGTISIGTAAASTVALGTSGGTVKLGVLGTATGNAQSVCRDSSTTNFIACDANTSGRPFLQGGNTFGATALLGTNDANNLQIETNQVVRATFDTSNNLYLGLGVTHNSPTDFRVAATGSAAAGAIGAKLTLQGGAGASSSTGSAGGDLVLKGGDAGGSNANGGGNVTIDTGQSVNGGTASVAIGPTNASSISIGKTTSNIVTAIYGQLLTKPAADSTTAVRLQNAAGDTVLNVDTTSANLITNNSFESGVTGWTGHAGAATPTQTVSAHYEGIAAGQVVTTTSNHGAQYNYALSSSTQYSFSIFARLSGGSFISTIEIGRSENGSADTSCATGQFIVSAYWSRITCTFTTGTVSGSTYLYIKQTDATGRTFYIDGAQLETAATPSLYRNGKLAIESSVLINGGQLDAAASNAALMINSLAGGRGLVVRGSGDTGTNTLLDVRSADDLTSYLSVTEAYRETDIVGGNSLLGTPAFTVTPLDTGSTAVRVSGIASSTVPLAVIRGGLTPGSGADLLQFQTTTAGPTYTTVARFNNAGNLFVAGSVDTQTGTGLGIGTSTATSVTIGRNTGTVTLDGTTNKVTTLGAATANSAAVCRDTSTNALTACDGTNTTGRAFLQGGNAFGTTATLGTTDANALQIVTGGSSTVRATFDNAYALYLGGGVTGTPNDFTVQGTGAASGGVTGAAIKIQGGSGNTTGAGGKVTLQGGTAGASGIKGLIELNGGTYFTTGSYSSGSTSTITQSLVDSNSAILASATAGSLTFTVPTPTNGVGGRVLYITNSGSNAFTLSFSSTSFTLNVGSTATLVYSGSAWTSAGVDASTLQNVYNNSTGSTTPEVLLDTTRRGIDIQDANSTLGSTEALLAVRASATASTLGNGLFVVNGGGKVGINLASTSTTPTISNDLSFGQIAGATTARTIGVEAQSTTNIGGNGLTATAGTGNGTGAGGLLTLQGGTSGSGAGATGGAVTIQGGTGNGSSSSNGGKVTIQGGTAGTGGVKGLIELNGGTYFTTGSYSSGSTSTITQSVVDSNSAILASATAGSLTFTVPSPSNGANQAGRLLYVINSGSNAFTLSFGSGSLSLSPNATATLVWTGTAWTGAGADSATLQNDYTNSTGGTTPELLLDSTRNGIDIQDNSLTSGTRLLAVRGTATASTLGSPLFVVDNTGKVGIGIEQPTRPLNIAVNSSSVASTMLLLDQSNAAGDSALEFKNSSTAASFFVGQDTSNGNSFTISSGTAAASSPATVTHVQSTTTAPAGGATTVSLAYGSNTTAGNLLVAVVAWDLANSNTVTCSDNSGSNVWSTAIIKLDPSGSGGNNDGLAICYSPNIVGGAATVTATFAGSSVARYLAIHEYSGAARVNPVDVTASNVNAGATGTDAVTSTAATTSQGGDLIFGATYNDTGSTTTITAGTGFTQRTLNSNFIMTEDKLQASPASVAATNTYAAVRRYISVMAAFKAQTSVSDTFVGPLFTMSQTGASLFKNSVDGSTAFQVQNAAGTTLLGLDTSTPALNLGVTGSTAQASTVNIGTSTGATQTVNIGGAAAGSAANGTTVLIQGGNTSSAVGIQALAGGTISVGTGNVANTVQIGSTTLNSGTQNINIGTNSTNGGTTTITIGTTGSATGSTTVRATGAVTITAGATSTWSTSTGSITVQAGASSGNLNLTGGAATGATTAGTVAIQGGAASATAGSNGGSVTITGAVGSTTGAGGTGGNITLTAGSAGGSGANAGGNVIAQLGAATSTGTQGSFQVQNALGASLLTVDPSNTAASLNLAVNSGGETASGFTTTYPAAGFGTSTVSQTTAAGTFASGTAAVQAVATAANSGIRANLGAALATSTGYIISFSAKVSTGSWTGDIDVRYNRTGTTSDGSTAVCTTSNAGASSFNTRSISSSIWTKITCSITTSASAGDSTANLVIFQTASATRTFYVDNISIVAQNSSGTQNVGDLKVGGALGQGLTLFTLDAYAGTPFTSTNSALAGSMYFDTTAGKIQCYDGAAWGACGAAPNSIVTLTPEYAGAVLNGTGIGTMTSDFCANSGALSVGTLCGTNDARNFYKWTSPQGTAQAYSIYVTYKLPSTFRAFVSGTTSLTGLVDNTTNAFVKYAIFKSTGSAITQCSALSTVVGSGVGSANAWTTGVAGTLSGTTDPSTCSFAAGNNVIFQIQVSANSNAAAYAENLNFQYSNQ